MDPQVESAEIGQPLIVNDRMDILTRKSRIFVKKGFIVNKDREIENTVKRKGE